jgi:tRNA(Ile2) C34 agmatinyltransferase TiaS
MLENNMHDIDPYDPDDPIYECPNCGARSDTSGDCEECSTTLQNITVPRE